MMKESTGQPQAVHGLRECKLKSCSKEFKPKNSTQEFHQPECKDTFHKIARQKGEALMNSKGIHYAKIEKSPRLKRLASLLKDCEKHTAKEIYLEADVMAASTAVAELREQLPELSDYIGFDVVNITCNYVDGYYRYQLITKPIIVIDRASGSDVTSETEWEMDKLDGKGPSGIIIEASKGLMPEPVPMPIEEHKAIHGQGKLF